MCLSIVEVTQFLSSKHIGELLIEAVIVLAHVVAVVEVLLQCFVILVIHVLLGLLLAAYETLFMCLQMLQVGVFVIEAASTEFAVGVVQGYYTSLLDLSVGEVTI